MILKGYSAAEFLADREFAIQKIDKEYVPSYHKMIVIDNADGSISLKDNPDYPYKTREEERIAKYKHEQLKREFILNYLKDNYPDTDYAEIFEKHNNWGNSLRYHTDETKKCEFLSEDLRHCNKNREQTTCYTCCFSCDLPCGECNDYDCKYINI